VRAGRIGSDGSLCYSYSGKSIAAQRGSRSACSQCSGEHGCDGKECCGRREEMVGNFSAFLLKCQTKDVDGWDASIEVGYFGISVIRRFLKLPITT
jgi:hypothetical protein